MYIYGESGSIGTGNTVILDIQYKFWSVFTNIYPKKILAEQWLTYFYDNNTDIVRVMSPEYTTDVAIWDEVDTKVPQKVTLKEIDLDDIFTQKNLSSIFLAFENYTQQVAIDMYFAVDRKNAKKSMKYINIIESPQSPATIGSNELGENLFGWEQNYSEISVPNIYKIDYNNDKANVWKLSISGKDNSFFYISAIDIMIAFYGEPKQYFKSANTY